MHGRLMLPAQTLAALCDVFAWPDMQPPGWLELVASKHRDLCPVHLLVTERADRLCVTHGRCVGADTWSSQGVPASA